MQRITNSYFVLTLTLQFFHVILEWWVTFRHYFHLHHHYEKCTRNCSSGYDGYQGPDTPVQAKVRIASLRMQITTNSKFASLHTVELVLRVRHFFFDVSR